MQLQSSRASAGPGGSKLVSLTCLAVHAVSSSIASPQCGLSSSIRLHWASSQHGALTLPKNDKANLQRLLRPSHRNHGVTSAAFYLSSKSQFQQKENRFCLKKGQWGTESHGKGAQDATHPPHLQTSGPWTVSVPAEGGSSLSWFLRQTCPSGSTPSTCSGTPLPYQWHQLFSYYFLVSFSTSFNHISNSPQTLNGLPEKKKSPHLLTWPIALIFRQVTQNEVCSALMRPILHILSFCGFCDAAVPWFPLSPSDHSYQFPPCTC